MIKYFSQMHTAQEPGAEAPMEAPETEGVKNENEALPDSLNELDEEESAAPEEEKTPEDDSAKDTVKFNMWVERTSKQAGYTVEVVPSSSNRALKVNIDDTTDIVTQKDAIKLAVLLDDNTMGWQLMDEPIVKSGGAWTIKMSRSEM